MPEPTDGATPEEYAEQIQRCLAHGTLVDDDTHMIATIIRHAIRQAEEAARVEIATLFVHVYNSGYHAGHEDTVEARYIDIFPVDMDEIHADVVSELLDELRAAAIRQRD